MEFEPLFTAYSVSPSGESVTADVAAPVYFRPGGSMPAGARASIRSMTLLRRRVDHRDLIGIVLRDIQPGLRCIERHPEGVAVQRDPRDQTTLRG